MEDPESLTIGIDLRTREDQEKRTFIKLSSR